MAMNNSKLLSGRVPVTPYSNLTSDRYQFLGLEQAEPSLGAGANNSVLTISTSNTRVWSNALNLSSLTVNGESNLGNVGNVKITGGTNGYILQTDGSGNLSWTTSGSGFGNLVAPMPTYIASANSFLVSENYQGLFATPITVDGELVVDGVLVDVGGNTAIQGNGTITASTVNVSGAYNVSGKKAVNGPAFRAYIATGQTILSNGAQQKVTFGSESFDTDGNFAASRFTPTVEGYYQLNSTVRISGNSGTGECMIILYKNGGEYSRGTNESGTEQGANFYSMQVSDMAYANGTTDYFEIYIQQSSGGNRDTTAGTNISYFSGCMVRGA